MKKLVCSLVFVLIFTGCSLIPFVGKSNTPQEFLLNVNAIKNISATLGFLGADAALEKGKLGDKGYMKWAETARHFNYTAKALTNQEPQVTVGGVAIFTAVDDIVFLQANMDKLLRLDPEGLKGRGMLVAFALTWVDSYTTNLEDRAKLASFAAGAGAGINRAFDKHYKQILIGGN